MEKPSKNGLHITEYIGERWRGFNVRVPGRAGKLFSPGRFGGISKARQAAIAYRDALCTDPMLLVGLHVRRKWPKNKSGSIGVYKVTQHGVRYYVAQWNFPAYKIRRKLFSIKKFGEAAAKYRAIEARKEAVKNIIQIFNGSDPNARA